MRYAQGGGLTEERRVFHEKLRVEAAERFVPERERGHAGVHVLDAVRRCVGRTLDPAATGDESAGAVVPAFADIAVVEVVDSVMRGDDPPQAPLPPGTLLMRTAFRSGPRYVFRGPARGPLASGPGMTVSPCRRHDLGG
ncbi:hypothetical protein ACFWJL_27765, partial [Streptomyces sp. NPDC127105]